MDIIKMKTDYLEIQNFVRHAFILNDLSVQMIYPYYFKIQ